MSRQTIRHGRHANFPHKLFIVFAFIFLYLIFFCGSGIYIDHRWRVEGLLVAA